MNLKAFTVRRKQDCFFGHYQQHYSQLMERIVPGAKCPKKDSIIVWEYGGRNGKVSLDRKSSKTKVIQEPEN
jgi:hypothetical protein